ncbi:MAG: ABC transporter permease [Oscillospiraceae bacterium]|nr:ABC transporter permease [Oscillospiraceae bacterium]
MKKSNLDGWQKVFSFTFVQHYKSKSVIVFLVLVILLAVLSGPLMSMIIGNSSAISDKISDFTECKIEQVYVKNETDMDVELSGLTEGRAYYKSVSFVKTDDDLDTLFEKFKNDEKANVNLILDIKLNDKKDKYNCVFYKTQDSKVSETALSTFTEELTDYFDQQRMKNEDLSDEDIKLINSSCDVEVTEIASLDKNDGGVDPLSMTIVIFYACIVMMIVLISSQQIAASIVIEKSSKVMETLLLSARPLAIVVGKIMATVATMLCNCILLIISVLISGVITSALNMNKMTDSAAQLIQSTSSIDSENVSDLSSSLVNSSGDLNIGRIAAGVVIIIITTIMGYFMYAAIAGITGAACSSVEDLSNGSAFISIMSVLSLYACMAVDIVNNPVFTKITYIFPFTAMFIVPVHFMLGKAGFVYVLIMWAILAALIVFLYRFTARVYQSLVLYSGTRLKLGALIGISKNAGKKV